MPITACTILCEAAFTDKSLASVLSVCSVLLRAPLPLRRPPGAVDAVSDVLHLCKNSSYGQVLLQALLKKNTIIDSVLAVELFSNMLYICIKSS